MHQFTQHMLGDAHQFSCIHTAVCMNSSTAFWFKDTQLCKHNNREIQVLGQSQSYLALDEKGEITAS